MISYFEILPERFQGAIAANVPPSEQEDLAGRVVWEGRVGLETAFRRAFYIARQLYKDGAGLLGSGTELPKSADPFGAKRRAAVCVGVVSALAGGLIPRIINQGLAETGKELFSPGGEFAISGVFILGGIAGYVYNEASDKAGLYLRERQREENAADWLRSEGIIRR